MRHLLLFAFCLALVPPSGHAQETRTYQVQVNGDIKKQVFLLAAPDGRLAAGKDDLAAWGLIDQVGARAQVEGLPPTVELYWLDEIQDIGVVVDSDNDVVSLEPTPESLDSGFSVSQLQAPNFDLTRGLGADLTYRASALTRPGDSPILDVRGGVGLSLGDVGRFEASIDAARRSISTTALTGGATTQKPSLVRDVRLRRDFGAGYVLHLGQLGAVPGLLTSGLNYVGASVGTNVLGRSRTTLSSRYTRFDDLLTLAEPATVEIRVNGRVIATRAVGAGRLSVSDIPIDAGDNDVQVMVRHADGRIEVFEQDIVGGVDLMGAGQSEAGAALGLLAAAQLQTEYRDPFGSVYFARGLSANHTVRWSAEGRAGDARHVAGRLEWASRLPGGLLGSAALAASASLASEGSVRRPAGGLEPNAMSRLIGGLSGYETDVRLERSFRSFRLAIGGSRSTERYLIMRQDGFARESRLRGRVDGRWSIGMGTLGLRYRYQEEWGSQGSHSAFASLQRRLGGGSIRLQGGYDGRPVAGGLSGSVGVTLGLGRSGTRANVNVRSSQGGSESVAGFSKSLASNARGVSWSLQLGHRSLGNSAGSSGTSGNASLLVRNSRFELRGGARNTGGTWSGNGEVAGSLVLLGGRLFASSPVGPSYLLVETGEGQGVSVMQNRRSVGKTDEHGGLLLPFVPALSTARIELDPGSLSRTMTAERLREEVLVGPGAMTVSFDVRHSLQAVVTLLDGDGVAWPPGTGVLGGDGRVVGIVGKDGFAQLTDLRVGEPLIVVAGPRLCTLMLELEPSEPGIYQFGEITCGE